MSTSAGVDVTKAAEETIEQRLDRWAVDHLDAAIELRELVRTAVLVDHAGGWRLVGKAIANLEVPDAATEPGRQRARALLEAATGPLPPRLRPSISGRGRRVASGEEQS